MNLTGLLAQSRVAVAEFLAARDAREMTMLAVAVFAGTSGLVYLLFIEPALTGRDQLNQDLPVLRGQVAQMQLLAKETAELSAKPAVMLNMMSKESIEADLARNGLKAQSVMLTGDYAKVQLAAVSFCSTLNWLDEWQKSARVSVVDANIVALPQADTVNAIFTLQQPKNE
jgi:general secretion pathway protein M